VVLRWLSGSWVQTEEARPKADPALVQKLRQDNEVGKIETQAPAPPLPAPMCPHHTHPPHTPCSEPLRRGVGSEWCALRVCAGGQGLRQDLQELEESYEELRENTAQDIRKLRRENK
jgi:hypothetical protein